MTGDEREEVTRLLAENRRLRELLAEHGIAWQPRDRARTTKRLAPLGTDEKVKLFAGLFRGREDVYPIRWESKSGKSGYSPACANEWRAGICEKPRVKCGDCEHRALIPVTGQTIFDHLAGRHTVGVYPLLTDDTCHFLAVDFDDAEWREDARAFAGSCDALGVPVALEVSRSGNGAHAWIFFSSRVSARDARRLGTALISHTCARTRQLKLSSYDRLFPNQDTMPKGGFGNLIALPLQKAPRESGGSVFVDRDLQPYDDQWAFLAGLPTAEVFYEPHTEACVVRRFDRQLRPDGTLARLVQYDLCQLAGTVSDRKYEKEGGPGLAACADLIRRYSAQPAVDLRHLVRWVFFNLFVGNNDSHAKNLSIHSVPGRGVTLTPFYDLMCTRLYPGLSPEFAFAIGSEVRPGEMGAKHLALMASQLGMQPRYLAQQARDMADRVPGAIDQATREIAPGLTPSACSLAERLGRFVSTTTKKLAARLAA
jgi:hypothetical protein